MKEITNERDDADVKCVSDGKRMFLKLGATAFAALAFDRLTAKSVAANDNRIFDLPMSPKNGEPPELRSSRRSIEWRKSEARTGWPSE